MRNKEINIFGQFTYMSQSAEKIYRNDCPIFSFMANLAYNCGITGTYDDEKDGDALVKKLGLHTDESGGWTQTFKALYDDFVKRWGFKMVPKTELVTFNKNDPIFDDILERGYAIRVGINVNRAFLKDSQDDGSINKYQNYSKYKGTEGDKFGHFFNVTKGVFNNGMKGKYHVIDSYHGTKKHNLYEIDVKKMKQNMYNTCYAVIPKI